MFHRYHLKRSVIAFITNMNENVWSHVGVTNNAFSITFLTQSSKRNAWLLSAEHKIRMMFGHF